MERANGSLCNGTLMAQIVPVYAGIINANRTLVMSAGPRVRGFKDRQNMWAKARFGSLGWAFWPSPPSPLDPPQAGVLGEG
jgi:hypothetical protein